MLKGQPKPAAKLDQSSRKAGTGELLEGTLYWDPANDASPRPSGEASVQLAVRTISRLLRLILLLRLARGYLGPAGGVSII